MDGLYPWVLTLHATLRWVVTIAGVLAAVRAVWGWVSKKEWAALDERLGSGFTVSMDVQVLLGVILYIFLSPLTQAGFQNFGAAIQTTELRFYLIEHISMMFVAVALAHVGRALARRASQPAAKHQRAAIFFGLAMLAVFAATPWGRPLNPFHLLMG
jgi:hypothetical protein